MFSKVASRLINTRMKKNPKLTEVLKTINVYLYNNNIKLAKD